MRLRADTDQQKSVISSDLTSIGTGTLVQVVQVVQLPSLEYFRKDSNDQPGYPPGDVLITPFQGETS
jgi:hypothetical protein